MAVGWDAFSQRTAMMVPNQEVEANPIIGSDDGGSLSLLGTGAKAKIALVGTIMIVVFFAAMAWGIGHLTGERLLHSVENAT